MTITKTFQKGSVWRKWDLQVQTRLDSDYSCLGNSLENGKLQQLINATQLTQAEITSQEKSMTAEKYAKLFVSYVTLFTDIGVIGITDHSDQINFIADRHCIASGQTEGYAGNKGLLQWRVMNKFVDLCFLFTFVRGDSDEHLIRH